MTEDALQPGVAGLGRRILLALGGFVVLLGGALGFIVGANSAGELTVIEPLTVPLTPLAMAGYGMGVVAVAIAALYGAVSFASRYDSNAQ